MSQTEKIRDKIIAALTPEEHESFKAFLKSMANDAVKFRNLVQERLNMDVAESFEAITGSPFPYEARCVIEWTDDAEKALGPVEDNEDQVGG